AQTALHQITDSLLRIMAPILSFTAEEAWPLFAPALWKDGGETIFSQTWHAFAEQPQAEALREKWAVLRGLRAEVLRQLEAVRSAGAIGSSLQAEVRLRLHAEQYEAAASLGDDLRFVLIVSQVRLEQASSAEETEILVEPSANTKCERCWHWRSDVG